jgi:hypothetical protein
LGIFTIPSWVPPAIVAQAEEMAPETAADGTHTKGPEIFERLIVDERMKTVWKELYKKKRIDHKSTEEFLHPAYLTTASRVAAYRQSAVKLRKKGGARNESEAKFFEDLAALLEHDGDAPTDPRWSEQDRAAQRFFCGAYRNALDVEPVFRSDLNAKVEKLRRSAKDLQRVTATLRSLGMKAEARKLEKVAAECDEKASNILPNRHSDEDYFRPQADDPWILTRRSGDDRDLPSS